MYVNYLFIYDDEGLDVSDQFIFWKNVNYVKHNCLLKGSLIKKIKNIFENSES